MKRLVAVAALAFVAVLVPALAGCTPVRFVWQGSMGQLGLATAARPIPEVIEDPATDPRTRTLLQEVLHVKSFGTRYGLQMHENYEEYVQLDGPFVVWFVNASEPLAFIPKTFTFPVVGSFPGLAWFDEGDAREFAKGLTEEGWDVNVRGVTAYSTGGWFDDPILSSMFTDDPGGLGLLVNVVLHESLHATVLVGNQQYFNESLASFVAGELTPIYLAERFGPESPELRDYLSAQVINRMIIALLGRAVEQLNAVYLSPMADDQKHREKARIFGELRAMLPFAEPPNNATLVGFSLYHEGEPEMRRLLESCPSWPAFIQAVASLAPRHFPFEQSPVIGPTFDALTANGCRPLPREPYRSWSKPQRERQRRSSDHEGER